MEKLRTRKVAKIITITAFGGLALGVVTGCGPNYSGVGNEFVVDGKVDHAGDQSITAQIYAVESASGDATNWFDDKSIHQLHDNCRCSDWGGDKTVGHVISAAGIELNLSDITSGECIKFTGAIRDNHEGKSYHERPVYTTAQVVEC